MFLFAFNLCKQINLFTKHIFANKDITIPYYIYSCFVRSSPLPRPDVMPAVCPSCRSSNTDSRGSCLPDQSARLLLSLGTLLSVLHPIGGILHPDHRQGARTSLLSAAGSLAPESKFQGEIDRCDYSYYQLFMCSFRVCFYRDICRLKR